MPEKRPDLGPEWQECRATVGRFDGYLEDTRKYGFTLVTLLLAANAVVLPKEAPVNRPAAAVVVLALLLALFMIDNFYWVMLKKAVKRARELEGPGHISSLLSDQAKDSHATVLVLSFYGLFVAIAGLVPIFTIFASDRQAQGWGVVVILAAVLIDAAAMSAVYLLVEHPNSRPGKTLKKTMRSLEVLGNRLVGPS